MNRARTLITGLGGFALLVAGLAMLAPAAASAGDGYLGVHIQDLDETLAAALDLEVAEGVLVSDVVDDSPAAEAGLERGDLILSIDGRDAVDAGRFTRTVRRLDAGETVDLQIRRRGETRTVEVTLAEAPEREQFGRLPGHVRSENGHHMWFDDEGGLHERGPKVFFQTRGGARLGVNVHGLDEDLGRYFGTDEGALVLGVQEESAALDAGLRPGDVIVGIDDETIADTIDLHEVVSDHEPGDRVAVRVLRDREEETLEVELGEDPGLAMVRELRGAPHAPRALRLETAPRVEFRSELEEELKALRERIERLEQEREN